MPLISLQTRYPCRLAKQRYIWLHNGLLVRWRKLSIRLLKGRIRRADWLIASTAVADFSHADANVDHESDLPPIFQIASTGQLEQPRVECLAGNLVKPQSMRRAIVCNTKCIPCLICLCPHRILPTCFWAGAMVGFEIVDVEYTIQLEVNKFKSRIIAIDLISMKIPVLWNELTFMS
jgi:hypothetical protein